MDFDVNHFNPDRDYLFQLQTKKRRKAVFSLMEKNNWTHLPFGFDYNSMEGNKCYYVELEPTDILFKSLDEYKSYLIKERLG